MSGRHAFSAASVTALGDSKVRTAAIALAAGAMFGTALPTTAMNSDSGARALADFTTSNVDENTTVAENPVVISADKDDFYVNQIVVDDSDAIGDVSLSVDVQRPTTPAPTARQANGTQASGVFNTPAGPLLSAEEAGSIVTYARQFVGTPYVYGGTTPAGFDCSGFVQYVFAQFGYSLPRTSGAQAAVGHRISAAEARPGDLVVWGTHHIGIYTGNGNHIAAHKPGVPLSESALYGSYYFVRLG